MDIIKLKDYNNIYAVDVFMEEYKGLFGKSSTTFLKYLKRLRTNLGILDQEMKRAIKYQQFEKLENQPLYAICHVSKVNPRVIFAYIDNAGKAVLLSSFKETKKADYDQAVNKAKKRMQQLEEES